MSSSVGNRKLEEDTTDSVEKVKQSVSDNMASTSGNSERILDKDGAVAPGIKTLFANLSADSNYLIMKNFLKYKIVTVLKMT